MSNRVIFKPFHRTAYLKNGRVCISRKAKYSYIPWREMSDIRNRIIHHYFGVDYDIVWDSVITDIPMLKEWIEAVIELEK
ncbi:HepT-like ribonuclease domain-containing protein [Daejeonella sp.]|uniref:HepT-like ribonuclease domain-containing protein n=1 Tax=Daejeonella sp. TaxID=2805397 RepID=UPI0030C4B6E1